MVNVLVTGGSGMVGTTLKQRIASNKSADNFYFISSSDYDLTDINEVNKCFNERKYDIIIHLAAMVGGLYKNMNNNSLMLMQNLKMNTNIVDACHRYGITRGIFCLSSCIYPKTPTKFPMTEEQLCESEPHESNEGYAYAKRMLYILCKHYNKDFGREYICLSPVNLYGSYDNFNIADGHVIPGLINRMFKTKHSIPPYTNLHLHSHCEANKFEVYGSGAALRQFLYAPDFCNALINILYNKTIINGLYNICDENEYTIKYIVALIAEILDFDEINIIYNKDYSDGIIKKTVSNEKLKTILPDVKFVDIKKGLKLTCDWFIQNLDNVRQ